MRAKLNPFKLFNATLLTLVVAVFSTLTSAQTLSVSGDSVTISVPGTTFSQVATLNNAGVVSSVTGVPTTGSLTTPTFSFTVAQATSESTTGTYSVGIILDEQSSNRRLEVFIPGVVMAFDASGNLTGSLSSPNVNIYGRDASGATQAATTVASGGSVNFNGSTLSFSAASQIALIQGQGGILADIITSINNVGLGYNFTVILARTAGTNHTFQHTDATPFPAAGAEFILGAGDNGVLGTASQKLTGTVTFAAVAVASGGGAPAELQCDEGFKNDGNDICVAIDAQAQEDLGDADAGIAALDDDSTPDEIEAAAADLAGAGDAIAELLAEGNTTAELGLDFVDSAKTATDAVVALAGTDPDAAAEAIGGLLTTIGTVSESLDPADLTDQQRTDLNNDIADTIDAVTDLVAAPGDLSDGAKESLIAAAEAILKGSVSANEDAIDAQNKAALVALLDELEEEDPGKPAVIKFSFSDLEQSIAQFKANISTSIALGLSVSEGQVDVVLEEVTSSLFAALTDGTGPSGLRFDSLDTGVTYVADIAQQAIVSSNAAEGVFELSNGNLSIIVNNERLILSPGAFDPDAFTAGLNAANVEITELPNGGLSISDGVIVALATFGFEDSENAGAGTSGAATFGGTTGADESDANYFFTVNYGNDVSQKLQPMINDDAFYDSVEGFGYTVTTDRATGIINIEGVGNFRPAYVVSPITFADSFTHNLNKDASGVSYAVTDANSDGVMDAVVFTDSSVQIVFGMP